MAVEAENICFDNMGFGSYTIPSAQDCVMATEFGIGMEILQYAAASSSLCCELESQRQQMDWFLQIENQKMRRCVLLEETRQREIIMQEYESRMKALILHKDQQLAAAITRETELKNSLQTAEIEAKTWQNRVIEKEATLSYLKNKLNTAVSSSDACSSSSSESESLQRCKVCKTGSTCSVFFPCRHLCCCNECEGVLGYCPVCGTVKEASLEVFLDTGKKL